MPTIISGDTGIDKIAAGAIEFADLPTGSVLQVVQASLGGSVTTNTGSFVTTGLTASITPKFSTSKILVLATINSCYTYTSNYELHLTIFRDGTNIAPTGSGINKQFGWVYGASSPTGANTNISYLDSPATTSSTTYAIYMTGSGSQTVGINANSATSWIQLLEIAA